MHVRSRTQSELLIVGIDGIQDKGGTIDDFYSDNDEEFPGQSQYERRFRATMEEINESVGEILADTEFRRVPLFYSLFGAVITGSTVFQRQT